MNQLRKFFRGFVMTQPQCKSARVQRGRSGMTLIELLVAISILVIIAAILVPQLRFASADRNIREASRMVASLFAEASQRASNEGVSGVVIERNPNITDGTGAYAGTSLFILREVPPYIGTGTVGSGSVTGSGAVQYVQASPVSFPMQPQNLNEFDPDNPSAPFDDIWIPAPFEEGIVQAGDQVSFNGQSLRLTIVSLIEETHFDGSPVLRLELQPPEPDSFVAGNIPPLNITDNSGSSQLTIGSGGFTVHRQPRRLVSSRIDLPTGYLVDLRLSGEHNTSGTSVFSLDPRATVTPDTVPNSVGLLFNGRGEVDRYLFTDAAGVRQRTIPTQPVYLMVREYSADEGGETIQNVLSSENQMWVTVDATTGAANVLSGLGVAFTTLPDALEDARQLGSQGQAAQ